MNFRSVTLLLFTLWLVGCSNSEDGIKAYKAENYSEAIKILTPLAKKGDSKAQEYLGLIYSKGVGVPEDLPEAVKWFKLAADQNNPDAQADLANMYAVGVGVPLNYGESIRLLKLAASQKNAYAEYRLGEFYQDGVVTPRDYFEALKWYKLSAEHGNSNAQYSIGLLYMFGNGVKVNYDEAYRWFKLSADQKNQYAQNALGGFYENGWVVDKDAKMAEKFYTESALQGYEPAKNNLAKMNLTPVDEWTKVSYTPDGTTAFVKLPAVTVSTSPLTRGIWVKFTSKDKSYSLTRDEYDCSVQKYRIMEDINYDSLGHVISSTKKPTDWSYIIPNTMTASVVTRACK